MSITELPVKQPDRSPVFVVGPPRSGTTLTAKIIGKHSRLFMPGETHFFSDIYSRNDELGDLTSELTKEEIMGRLRTIYGRYNEPPDQQRIDRLLDTPEKRLALQRSWTDYESVLTSFMAIQANNDSKLRWGNNAPRDLFFLDEIFSFYPNAKCVVCIRDPRDFLVSYKNRFRVTVDDQKSRIGKLYHPVVTSLLWKSSAAKIDKALKDPTKSKNIHVMKYETLVTEPEIAIRHLCEFLDEPYEPSMLDVETHNSSASKQQAGIFSSSIGRWKSELSSDEVAILQSIAGNQMSIFGYEPETVDSRLWSSSLYYLNAPLVLLRALHANKEMTGPVFPYLMRRLSTIIK